MHHFKAALAFCGEIRATLAELREKEATLRNELAIFGISLPENPEQEKLEKELATLELVWELTNQWDDAWQRYKSGNFWELETDEMENMVCQCILLFYFLKC